MEDNDIIKYWGADRLFRWDGESLRDLNVSARSKEFLHDVGLPIHPHKRMLLGGTALASLPPLDGERSHLRVIGLDISRKICIDERFSGRVVWIDVNRRGQKFMNSSVEQLGICVTAFNMATSDRTSITWDEGRTIEEAAVSELTRVDEAAFADGDDFWPMAFEQLGV